MPAYQGNHSRVSRKQVLVALLGLCVLPLFLMVSIWLVVDSDKQLVLPKRTSTLDSRKTNVAAQEKLPNVEPLIIDAGTDTATLPPTNTVSPSPTRIPPICNQDLQGANDFTGQKDLTKMCSDISGLPTRILVDWNWDEVAWTGGNTGDACALFDTNSNSNADYALCVTVGGQPATFNAQFLYSCSDTRTDRCSGSTPIAVSPSTVCTASIQSDDPFPLGDNYPEDTQGSCNILLSDISTVKASMIDVCSYPSQQPNSNPSDCIVAPAGNFTPTPTLSPATTLTQTPTPTTPTVGTLIVG